MFQTHEHLISLIENACKAIPCNLEYVLKLLTKLEKVLYVHNVKIAKMRLVVAETCFKNGWYLIYLVLILIKRFSHYFTYVQSLYPDWSEDQMNYSGHHLFVKNPIFVKINVVFEFGEEDRPYVGVSNFFFGGGDQLPIPKRYKISVWGGPAPPPNTLNFWPGGTSPPTPTCGTDLIFQF